MSSQSSKSGVSRHIISETVANGKWITLNNITYSDPTGKTRVWEAVGRTTKCKGEADAVAVIATVKNESKGGQCVVLVRQYRPPMQAYTVEFPAGLIDEGETAEQAAVREMKEETGYTVKVNRVLPACAGDPGLASSTLKFALCQIDTSLASNKNPQAVGGGADEFVEVRVEPLSTLLATLAEYAGQRDIVDSRLYSWALGLQASP